MPINTRLALSTLLFVLTAMTFSQLAPAAELAENRVAVVIDVSGSFKDKQAEAISAAAKMLEGMADVKLKRWEPAKDKIILVSLDAMPEVVWSGCLRELKELDQKSWKNVFEKRTDYVQCTDVTKAFKLAVDELDKDAGQKTFKYMFVYSDLVHEPPTDTICSCAPINKKAPVPSDFPWEALKQIRVAVFWVPGQQKYVWSKAVEEHGLTASFNLYASESEAKEILPPPRPDNKPTAQEVTATRERVKSWFSGFLKVGGAIVGAFVALIVLLLMGTAVYSRFRRPQRPQVHSAVQRRPMHDRRPMGDQRHANGPVRRPQPRRSAPPQG